MSHTSDNAPLMLDFSDGGGRKTTSGIDLENDRVYITVCFHILTNEIDSNNYRKKY